MASRITNDTGQGDDGGTSDQTTDELKGFDAALEIVGSWGPWQKQFFVYASTAQIFTAMGAIASGRF